MPIFNVCGTNYQYPNVGEKPWGTIHIAWASAVSSCLTSLNTQVSGIATNQFVNPMTVDGDLITQTLGTPTRLGIGADGQVLTVVAGVPEWTSVAGTGDVVGPVSSVDENIAVFDGITGKLLKDGGISIAAVVAQTTFPAGTKLPFYQGSAPTGWVIDSSVNDKFIRISSSTGGVTGGSFSNLSHSHTMTHTHTEGTYYARMLFSTAGGNDVRYDQVTAPGTWSSDVEFGVSGSASNPTTTNSGVKVDGVSGSASSSNTGTQTISHGSSQHAYADFIICTKS